MQRRCVRSSPDFECLVQVASQITEPDRCRCSGFVYLASSRRNLDNADSHYDYHSRLTDDEVARRRRNRSLTGLDQRIGLVIARNIALGCNLNTRACS